MTIHLLKEKYLLIAKGRLGSLALVQQPVKKESSYFKPAVYCLKISLSCFASGG